VNERNLLFFDSTTNTTVADLPEGEYNVTVEHGGDPFSPAFAVVILAAGATKIVEFRIPRSVTGIIPAFGYCNGTLVRADITGTSFASGASVMLVRDGTPDIPATNVSVTSPSGITCTFSLEGADPGIRSVRVTNPDAMSGVLADAFTVRIRGDFNGDGEVDIGDVARVAYMVVSSTPQDPEADFNGNGIADIGDASKIAYFFVGKVTVL